MGAEESIPVQQQKQTSSRNSPLIPRTESQETESPREQPHDYAPLSATTAGVTVDPSVLRKTSHTLERGPSSPSIKGRRKTMKRIAIENIMTMTQKRDKEEHEKKRKVEERKSQTSSRPDNVRSSGEPELSCATPVDPEMIRQQRQFLEEIAADPKSPELRVELGNWCYHHNRRDEAQFQYEAALRLDPLYESAHFSLATLHHQHFFDIAKSHHMTANAVPQTMSTSMNQERRRTRRYLEDENGNLLEDSSDDENMDQDLIYDTVVTHSITVSPATLFSDQYKERLRTMLNHCENARVHYEYVLRLDEEDLEAYYQLGYLFLTLVETLCYPSVDDITSEVDIPGIVNITSILDRNDWDDGVEYDMYSMDYDDPDKKLFVRNALWWKNIFEYTAEQFRNVMALNSSFTGAYAGLGRLYLIQCAGPYQIFWKWSDHGKTVYSRTHLLNEARRLLDKAIREFGTQEPLVYHDMALASLANTVHDQVMHRKLMGRQKLMGNGALEPMPMRKIKCAKSNYDDANQYWYTAFTHIDDTNPIFFRRLGHLFQMYLGNMQGAIYFYERSLELQGHVQAYNNLASILVQSIQSKHQTAETMDQESKENLEKAIVLWNYGLEIDPNHAETHRNLGNTLWIFRNDTANADVHLQKAIACAHTKFRAVLSVSKDFPAKSDKVSMSHDPNDRLRALSFIVLARSDYALLLSNAGLCEDALRQLELGIRMLDDEYSNRHMDGKKYQYATTYVPNVGDIDIETKCACVYYYYAKLMYEERKAYRVAKMYLEKYLRVENASLHGNLAHANYLLARIEHEFLKEYANAIEHYRCAIDRFHDSRATHKPRPRSSFLSVSEISQMYLECHIGLAFAILDNEIVRSTNDDDEKKEYETLDGGSSADINMARRSATAAAKKQKETFGEDDHVLTAAFVTNSDTTLTRRHSRTASFDDSSQQNVSESSSPSSAHVRAESDLIRSWYTTSCIREVCSDRRPSSPKSDGIHPTDAHHALEECKKYLRFVLKFTQDRGRRHRTEDEDDKEDDEEDVEESPANNDIMWTENELKCHLGLARLYFFQNSIRNCELQFQKMIKICRSKIGEMDKEAGSSHSSMKRLKRELRSSFNCLVDLIWCSFHMKRWREAIKYCKEAIKMDNEMKRADLEIHVKLCVLLWNRGEDVKAKQTAKATIELATTKDEKLLEKKRREMAVEPVDGNDLDKFILDAFPHQARVRQVLDRVLS